jgi:hypothetical protein
LRRAFGSFVKDKMLNKYIRSSEILREANLSNDKANMILHTLAVYRIKS